MLAGLSGRGIRIAVVDSGVHASHPHVGGVAGGVSIDGDGAEGGDYVDRLGHGTAVIAAIRETAPDAEIFAVKVFDRSLATSIGSLVGAMAWAARSGMHVINLSLGTAEPAHEPTLRAAVARAADAGVLIVSACDDGTETAVRWLPGSLAGVVAVRVDWQVARDRYRFVEVDGAGAWAASGFAREIPGVPPERNLHGVSFAVAHVTGFVARAMEAIAPDRSLDGVLAALRDQASV